MEKPPKDTSAQPALPPVVRKTLKSGLINMGAVSENERPASSVMESVNFHFDAIGSATLRKGSTLLGAALTGPILGLHYFADTVGLPTFSQLVTVAGTAAYYLSSGTWTSTRTGLTASSKARFVTYLNLLFMVNGTEATAVWDGNPAGSGWLTTGNASGAPIGSYIENFLSRIWIAGNATYPDRLYYSSVPSAASTPVVSWSTDPVTGTQWIDISPSDGDTITGLQRFRQWLLIFKTNHVYRLLGIGQVDPDPYYAVGTSSQESVVETKNGIYFHHSSGIYVFNIYGIAQEVSRPIWDIIKAIPASYYPSIVGWLEADQDHVCWSVGTVTVNGTTYANHIVRFTISTQAWTHYDAPNAQTASIRRQPFYYDGTNQYVVTGDSAGNIAQMNKGTVNYDGSPIIYSLIHGWDFLDGLLSTRKTMTVGNFCHYGGTGSTITFQTDANDPQALNDWSKGIGTLRQVNTGFSSMNIKARKVRFRISGKSTGQPFIYNGYELLDVINEYYQFPNNGAD